MLIGDFDLKFMLEIRDQFSLLTREYRGLIYCNTRRIILRYVSLRVCTDARKLLAAYCVACSMEI